MLEIKVAHIIKLNNSVKIFDLLAFLCVIIVSLLSILEYVLCHICDLKPF